MPADLQIRQGDTDPDLSVIITDETGAVLNLTGASVQFVMRSQTALTPAVSATATIVTPASGIVSYSWVAADTAVAGLYAGEFRVTKSGGQTYTWPNDGYLDIWIEPSLTGLSQQLVSLSDTKDYLNIPAADRTHDQKLGRYISAMSPIIQNLTTQILTQTFDEWRDGGSSTIALYHRPVLGLLACSMYMGSVEYPMAIVNNPAAGSIYSVMLDAPTGIVTRRGPGGGEIAFPGGEQAVHFVYRAGLTSVPDNIRMATLELIRVNYQKTQQAGPRGPGADMGDELVSNGPAMGFFVPNRVRELLGPHRRYPSIA